MTPTTPVTEHPGTEREKGQPPPLPPPPPPVPGVPVATKPVGWRRVAVIAAMVVVVALVAATAVWGVRTAREVDNLRSDVSTLRHQVRQTNKAVADVAGRLERAEGEQSDVSKISATDSPSVFTVQAGGLLGSSWVARSDERGADLVTNFHVVQELWDGGTRTVTIANPTRVLEGMITLVRPTSDLALIHVGLQLPALKIVTARPEIGDPVVVFGSPLGLAGTVTTGVVSAYRTEKGVEFLQFSAPVSPGSSGGPVVDHDARVVGVTTAKAVESGAEGVSFAVPSDNLCRSLDLAC